MSVSIVDALLEIRASFDKSFIPYVGEARLERIVGFIDGYSAAHYLLDVPDERGDRFFLWLRDTRGEFPPEGWAEKFLREERDDRRAIKRFLDLVYEFALLEAKGENRKGS